MLKCPTRFISHNSGLLVAYLTLKQMAKRNGSFNWGLFYFHRWWRITPMYMIVLAVWATLFLQWGQGPGHNDTAGYINGVCHDLWWTHFVYINNLYPFPGDVNVGTVSNHNPIIPMLVKSLVFPVMLYGAESWRLKLNDKRRINAFELWSWRRVLRIPWTAKRRNTEVIAIINPTSSLEALVLKQKMTYFGHVMARA